MSTFEIVRGIEGDCLVLDGTRICGPKPWGGGRTINTFRTDGIYEAIDKDEYRKLMAENAKLRELATRAWGLFLKHAAVHPFDMAEVYAVWEDMRELGIEVGE